MRTDDEGILIAQVPGLGRAIPAEDVVRIFEINYATITHALRVGYFRGKVRARIQWILLEDVLNFYEVRPVILPPRNPVIKTPERAPTALKEPKKSAVSLPETGFVRLATILEHLPISRSTWWKGVREGRFPQSVKLGPRMTAWRAADIRDLLKRIEQEAEVASAEEARRKEISKRRSEAALRAAARRFP